MSGIGLLLVLLVLAYTGSILVGGRAIRGFGLPSGSEYLLLGFVVGPHALNVAERSVVGEFAPLALVGMGWLALVTGLDFGVVGERRIRKRSVAVSLSLGVATAAVVACPVAWLAEARFGLPSREAWLLGGGMGAALSETTRHAVRWVVQRHSAQGPLSNLIAEVADADDAVGLLLLAALFAFGSGASAEQAAVRLGITLGGGIAVGVLVAILFAMEHRLSESWGLLIGAALIAIGGAARLELAVVSTCFLMGVTLSLLSRHREEIRNMLRPTHSPVVLPVLLLAGATVDVDVIGRFGWLVAAALAARVLAKLLGGAALARVSGAPRGTARAAGLGMLSSGSVSVMVGLAYALQFPGDVGKLVLLTAVLSSVLGELVGPLSLRSALLRAGEIGASSSRRAEATP